MSSHRTPKATAGVCLIELLQETGPIVFTSESRGKIVKGKVISVGKTGYTDWAAKVEAPCKVGDIVWFLKYENGYDSAIIDGKEYIFAAFKDIRAIA